MITACSCCFMLYNLTTSYNKPSDCTTAKIIWNSTNVACSCTWIVLMSSHQCQLQVSEKEQNHGVLDLSSMEDAVMILHDRNSYTSRVGVMLWWSHQHTVYCFSSCFCYTLLHRHCRMFVQEWWFTVWPTGCLLYIFLVDGHPERPASSKDVTPCLTF
jgi:hypothetical protein